MPRIYSSTSDHYDFCKECYQREFPTEDDAFDAYGHMGDGPDGRGNCFGYDCDHPSYDDDIYRCTLCNQPLTDEDY